MFLSFVFLSVVFSFLFWFHNAGGVPRLLLEQVSGDKLTSWRPPLNRGNSSGQGGDGSAGPDSKTEDIHSGLGRNGGILR